MVQVTLEFQSEQEMVEFFTRRRPVASTVSSADKPEVDARPIVRKLQVDPDPIPVPEPALIPQPSVTVIEDDTLRQAALDLGRTSTPKLKEILTAFGLRRVTEVEQQRRAELLGALRAAK